MELESNPAAVEEATTAAGIGFEFLSSVVGVSSHTVRDLTMHTDEVETLCVAEFVRLCVTLRLQPADVIPSLAESPTGEEMSRPASSWLSARLRGQGIGEDQIGFYQTSLDAWLVDDRAIGDMPLPALRSICNALGIDMRVVFSALAGDVF